MLTLACSIPDNLLTAGKEQLDPTKCALKTVDPKDYNVGFTPSEQGQLSSIFPNGICDYSQPGIGQQPLLGTYLLVQ